MEENPNSTEKKIMKNNSYCGVYQCGTYRRDGFPMFTLPKDVQASPMLYYQWSKILRNGDPFPKHFYICGRHFEKHHILIPHHSGNQQIQLKTQLSNAAFPVFHLPNFEENPPRKRAAKRSNLELSEPIVTIVKQSKNPEIDPLNFESDRVVKSEPEEQEVPESIEEVFEMISEEVENYYNEDCTVYEEIDSSDSVSSNGVARTESFNEENISANADKESCNDKNTSANVRSSDISDLSNFPGTNNDKSTFANFTTTNPLCFLFNTDKNLQIMTGLNDTKYLDLLTRECINLSGEDIGCMVEMKNDIILTMFKLKTNASLMQITILFQISNTFRRFANTIKLLAGVLNKSIVLQSKQQITRNSPMDFYDLFPKVRLIVECIEIQSIQPLKTIIAFTPCGEINYVSKAVTGKFSDLAVLRQADLLKKLNRGDVIMAKKELVGHGNPNDIVIFNMDKKEPFQEDERFIKVKKNVDECMKKIRSFKIVDESLELSLRPFVTEIMIVVCALVNESQSICID